MVESTQIRHEMVVLTRKLSPVDRVEPGVVRCILN